MQTILEHRSIRKYTDGKVSAEDMKSILTAAMRASNTGNMQMVSIVVTTTSEGKQALSPCHFNQPCVNNAAAVLTVCADVNRLVKWCDVNGARHGFFNFQTLYTATVDAAIAAQNAALEAEYKGYGICYLGTTTYNAPQIIDVLKLPKGVIPVTTITIGRPAVMPGLTERLPLEAMVHYEAYKDYTDEDIKRLYAEKESLESNRQFCSENSKQNLAQVFAEVRYPKEQNEHFSTVLLNLLKQQGFVEG